MLNESDYIRRISKLYFTIIAQADTTTERDREDSEGVIQLIQIQLDHERLGKIHSTQAALNERRSKRAYHLKIAKDLKKEIRYFESMLEELVHGS